MKSLELFITEKIKRGYTSVETILHSDQGSVYASRAFQNAHQHYNIIRSMSRAKTPTDNPIIEALNGWMKNELYIDFDLQKTLFSKLQEKKLKKNWNYFDNNLPTIFFIGRLTQEKKINLLIETVINLNKSIHKFNLLIIGGGIEQEKLKSQAAELIKKKQRIKLLF